MGLCVEFLEVHVLGLPVDPQHAGSRRNVTINNNLDFQHHDFLRCDEHRCLVMIGGIISMFARHAEPRQEDYLHLVDCLKIDPPPAPGLYIALILHLSWISSMKP